MSNGNGKSERVGDLLESMTNTNIIEDIFPLGIVFVGAHEILASSQLLVSCGDVASARDQLEPRVTASCKPRALVCNNSFWAAIYVLLQFLPHSLMYAEPTDGVQQPIS